MIFLQAPDARWKAALSSAALAVSEAFQEVLQDWQRATAQNSSSSSSSSKDSTRPAPQQPTVQLEDDRFLSVSIPLLPGADLASLLALINRDMAALARQSSSSSQSQQQRVMSTSKVVQFDLHRSVKAGPPCPQQQQQQHAVLLD